MKKKNRKAITITIDKSIADSIGIEKKSDIMMFVIDGLIFIRKKIVDKKECKK